MRYNETVLQRIQRERAERMTLEARREAYRKDFWRNVFWMSILGPLLLIGSLALYVLVAGM